MTAAALYLSLILLLLWRNSCFGIFKDDRLTKRFLILLFFLKTLAIPTFYLIYEKHYGGLAGFDSGKFYHDAAVLNDCAKKHPATYISVLAGNERHDCLDGTQNWKQGRSKKFFFNDNHFVIAWHSLLHFLPFAGWPVHALFDCLLSFTGLFLIYRTFRHYFPGKEKQLMLLICLLPSLWLYTGAVLKEGLVMFVMGATARIISLLIITRKIKYLPGSVLLLLVCCFLKPYLLLTFAFTAGILFLLESKTQLTRKAFLFLVLFFSGIAACNFLAGVVLKKSFIQLLTAQEKAFSGTAGGGIFLSGETTFVQLPYDTSLIQRADGPSELYRIRKGAAFMYWEDHHNQDTLYNDYNRDTVTQYELAFMTPRSRSNYQLPPLTVNPMEAVSSALYHTALHPLFIGINSPADLLASFENLLIMICLAVIVTGIIRHRRPALPAAAMLCFVFVVFLIVGLSSPNTGAVFRYRAPALLFLVMAGLYYFRARPRHSQLEKQA